MEAVNFTFPVYLSPDGGQDAIPVEETQARVEKILEDFHQVELLEYVKSLPADSRILTMLSQLSEGQLNTVGKLLDLHRAGNLNQSIPETVLSPILDRILAAPPVKKVPVETGLKEVAEGKGNHHE